MQESAIDILANIGAEYSPLETGHVPLDADVTPLDNSKSKKEGVSRTYKGMDGYAPMAAYLGREGYCLEFELRDEGDTTLSEKYACPVEKGIGAGGSSHTGALVTAPGWRQ